MRQVSTPADAASGRPLTNGRRRPRFSIIVPVFNRSASLRRLLQALAAQDFPPDRFEILVCDDGSTEDLAAIVRGEAEAASIPMVYLREENRGAGPARNLGMDQSAGEILAFTDSDCVPDPDWLRALDRSFEDPAIG